VLLEIKPRILIISMNRINESDSFNNGLLFRNLFEQWPKDSLAQIFSGGDNGDQGFFGHYYGLQQCDRLLGKLFFKIKPDLEAASSGINNSVKEKSFRNSIRRLVKNAFIASGLYELIFRIRLSDKMIDWIRDFKPDIIFAQGYNLTFILLPIRIKKVFINCRVAFLATDDWPTYLYSGMLGENKTLSYIPRRQVKRATKRLMTLVDIPFGFGVPMTKEYERRYSKKFFTISHLDDPSRFITAPIIRNCPSEVFSIVTIGNFNQYRWPLLLDLNESCKSLLKRGINSSVTVISSIMDPEAKYRLAECEFVNIIEDPGNDLIPSYLKGSDVLFLPEGFNQNFVSAIRLSVSSKAHLFMFSQKPIIVYAHSDTGVSSYARDFKWAIVVTERSIIKLTQTLLEIRNNPKLSSSLSSSAYQNALEMHNKSKIQKQFEENLSN